MRTRSPSPSRQVSGPGGRVLLHLLPPSPSTSLTGATESWLTLPPALRGKGVDWVPSDSAQRSGHMSPTWWTTFSHVGSDGVRARVVQLPPRYHSWAIV